MGTHDLREEQRSAAYQQALAAAMPVPVTPGRPAGLYEQPHGGLLGAIFGNRETKRHVRVQQTIDNVVKEVIQAQEGLGLMAQDAVAVAFEFERGNEQLLYQYRDSELVLATAPAYMQQARATFASGAAGVHQAGVDRIRGLIGR